MSAIVALLDFAGYVALVLWGVHMVQSGVQRAFGARLSVALGRALGTPLRAFASGLTITAALQSSTATGLMISSFAGAGLVSLSASLAAMLGANVGTTLIVQLLSFDLTPLAPILILVGVWLFRRQPPGTARDLGRVFIGLGLLLLALHQLVSLFAPLQNAPLTGTILEALASQPVIAVVVAMLFTWAAHSSVAVVVLIMSLADHGMVAPATALALVLGANLGTSINPLTEGVNNDDPASKRLPLGNFMTRVVGVILALMLLPWITQAIMAFQPESSRAVANFHTLFNLAVAIVFLPLLVPFSALLTKWLPRRVDPDDPARPAYLDDSAHDVPAVALGLAARESLRMCDILQTLLLYGRAGAKRSNLRRMVQARQLDRALDRLELSITTYLATLDQENMTEDDRLRREGILGFSSNVGHAGDAAYHGVLSHLNKMRKSGWELSTEQRATLDETFARLISNQRQAAALFVNEDLSQARALANEKEYFRELESNAAALQLNKIKKGDVASADIGALYLDILRDMKTINSHLVGASAYPLLARRGQLLASRLKERSE